MGRVVVVGSVNVDLVIRGPRLPAPGETVLGGTFERHHGGKGGNQAVAAARLGVEVAFVGAVGGDDFGVAAVEALRAEDVSVDAVATIPDVATGIALILVDDAGENLISVAPGANGEVSVALVTHALERLAPGEGDVVLVSCEVPLDAVRAALEAGRKRGATTILNPAPASGLDRSILANVNIVSPNSLELRQLAGGAGASPASLLAAEPSLRAVLLTQGSDGATLATRDGDSVGLPALAVTAVDATGAGDTLNGALAASLASGHDVGEAARRAVAAASVSVTRPGAREGMPTSNELDRVL